MYKLHTDGLGVIKDVTTYMGIGHPEYLTWLALGNTPLPADPPPPPDYGDLNYKALIRRQADDLGNAGQYWEAIKLLKTIGE
jgi:hypothetical protein